MARLRMDLRACPDSVAWITADVECLRTNGGWLCLAPVIGIFCRRVAGYAISIGHDASPALDSLWSATGSRGVPKDVPLHSDRSRLCGDGNCVRKRKAPGIRRIMN